MALRAHLYLEPAGESPTLGKQERGDSSHREHSAARSALPLESRLPGKSQRLFSVCCPPKCVFLLARKKEKSKMGGASSRDPEMWSHLYSKTATALLVRTHQSSKNSCRLYNVMFLPGEVVSALHVLTYLILPKFSDRGILSIPTLRMRKPRQWAHDGEQVQLLKSKQISEWQRWHLSPVRLSLEPTP